MPARLLALIFLALLCNCASEGTHPRELPGTINPIGTHPMVNAYAHGQALALVPDSGAAQQLVLFAGSAEKLGLRFGGDEFLDESSINLTYSPGAEEGFDRAYILDAPVGEFDGLIGWPEIQRGVWHIDLPARRHSFHVELPEKVRSWKSLEIIPDQRILRVRTNNGREAVIDTGASRAIHFDRELFDAWLADHPRRPVTLYSGYSPAARDGYFAKRCTRASYFDFGPLRFRDIMIYESFAEVASPTKFYNIDLLLGLEAFGDREIWIDGPGHRLYVSPPQRGRWTPGRVSLVRAVFIPDQKQKLTARVLPGGAAYRAGLRNGDLLLAINGSRSFSTRSLKSILSLPGKRASILVRRRGTVRRLTWVVPTRF